MIAYDFGKAGRGSKSRQTACESTNHKAANSTACASETRLNQYTTKITRIMQNNTFKITQYTRKVEFVEAGQLRHENQSWRYMRKHQTSPETATQHPRQAPLKTPSSEHTHRRNLARAKSLSIHCKVIQESGTRRTRNQSRPCMRKLKSNTANSDTASELHSDSKHSHHAKSLMKNRPVHSSRRHG